MTTPIDIFIVTRGHFLIFLIAVFAVVFAFQLLFGFKKIKSIKVFKIFYCASAAFPFLYYVYLTYAQYVEWKGENGVAKYLVPPYTGAGYVVKYHFIGFYMYYLISLMISLIFLFAAIKLNEKFGERFFEKEEPYLGALAINLTGTPGFVVYLAVLLVGQLLSTLTIWIIARKNERVPFYYLWLPAGVFAILIMYMSHLFYFN